MKLIRLHAFNSKISDNGIDASKTLQVLNINNNRNITDKSLKQMNLVVLYAVGDCNITDEGIKHMTNMRKLYICNNYNITDDGLKNMKLIELSAGYSNITNKGIAHMDLRHDEVDASEALLEINFTGNPNITRDGIKNSRIF